MYLFQEELMDHYRFSPYRKTLAKADFSEKSSNPSCGDQIFLQGIIENGCIVELAFQAEGCILSQAAMSLLIEESKGKSCDDILALRAEDIFALLKIQLGPNRAKCALLSLDVLRQGVVNYCEKKSCLKI